MLAARWDEIPKEIADPEATVPDDWDEADDGEWEPPNVPNPEYKGEWSVKRIENPAYKGEWVHPEIDNPEYKDDATIAQYPDFGVLAFEVWQVKSGTIFDSIMITDDEAEAKAFSEATYTSMVEAEKKAKDEADEAKRAAEKEAEKEEEKAVEKEYGIFRGGAVVCDNGHKLQFTTLAPTENAHLTCVRCRQSNNSF